METDLLKKEDEFYEENEKLEQRRKELMEKVNYVMKIQDNLIKESLKAKVDINLAKQNNENVEYLEDNKIDNQLTIHKGMEQIGTKGATQYYKAKFKSLQVEVVKLQEMLKTKTEEIKKIQKENQSFQEEKDKWFVSYNSSKTAIGKLENQISILSSKLQDKSTELSLTKKELELTKKNLKSSTLNANSLEIRLTRAQEENEQLKNALKSAKDEEKEIKDTFKKHINDLTTTVKHIEKHKLELLDGFKKQLQLIDNLKKQKMYLEELKMEEILESEYLKILDWKWN